MSAHCCAKLHIHYVLCYRETLSNGHLLKSSSLEKAPSLENSFQVPPADNFNPYLQNNAVTAEGTPDASQTDASQDTADIHLPASSEADATSTAVTYSAPEHTIDQTALTDEAAYATNSSLTSSLTAVQAPTSDLREGLQPATAEQTVEIKERKLAQDLFHNPELTNGLTSSDAEPARSASKLSEHIPEAARVPQVDTLSLPNEDQTTAPTDGEQLMTMTTVEIPHHPPVPVPEGAETEAPIDPAPSPAQVEQPSSPPTNVLMPTSPEPNSPVASQAVQSSPVDQIMDGQDTQEVFNKGTTPSGSSDQNDQAMQDARTSSAKVARPREEDDVGSQPAVKRPRTDGDEVPEPEFKKPDRPEISTNVDAMYPSPAHLDSTQPLTAPQQKQLTRILGILKRTADGRNFAVPVDPIGLNIPTYPDYIKNPMDLTTMENKLENNEYPTIDAFLADFQQIIQNTEIFNGPQHLVTLAGYKMKSSLLKQMEKLPGPEVAGSARADKKKKGSVHASEKPVAPRRESRSSLPGTGISPVTPSTFGLGPEGIPIIRRVPTMTDRPKREIHAPAKDLPYASQKPKKKKYQTELKFCQYVLDEIHKPRYNPIASAFLKPVDTIALNIPTYFNVVKRPMDFGTMQTKLTHGEYENAKEFDLDARLVFANCFKFNPAGNIVHLWGKELEDIYKGLWQEKNAWVDKHTPASGPTSAGTTPEPSDHEEDEEEEEEPEQNEIIKLQQQIAAMSKQVELITQKKKSPPAASKKAKTAAKPDKKSHKKAAPPPPSKSKSSARPSAKGGASTKPPYVTYEQKQDISNRINSLPEVKMGQALNIIRDNMPKLKVRPQLHLRSPLSFRLQITLDPEHAINVRDCLRSTSATQGVEDDELELDIDELDNEVLYKLLLFVRKHAPKSEDPVRSAPAPAPVATSSRKKNKPMSKVEQENRIQQVRGSLSAFDNPGPAAYATRAGMFSVSPQVAFPTHSPLDSNAVQDDSSGDEEDSEESEEE